MTDTTTLTTPKATPERRTFGRLFQRKRVWYLRYRSGGRERVESLKTTSRAIAERKAAVIEDHVGRGDHQGADVRRVSYADLETLIRADYKTRGLRSLARLNSALAHLAETFGATRASAITSDAIVRYHAARLAAGAAPATVAYELAAMRRMFRLAVKHRRLSSAPSITISAPQNARTGFVSRDDFDAIVAELPDCLRAPITFAFLTGWRIREVLGLEWRHVDLDAGTVTLDAAMTKSGASRSFPFSALPELDRLLRDQRDATRALERAEGRVIARVFHRAGRPIKSYHNAWSRAIHRAARGGSTEPLAEITRPAIVGRLVHDLRRSAARSLVHAGVPEHTAMQLLGHKTPSMFRRYAIQDATDLRNAVAKLAAASAPIAKASKPAKGRKPARGTTGVQSHLRAVGES